MKRSLALAAAALAAAWSVAHGAPLSAYGRLPMIEQAVISPDGERLALIVTDGEARRIEILPSATLKVQLWADAGDRKVRGLTWAGADHLLISTTSTSDVPFVDGPREEWKAVVDLNVATHRMARLLRGVAETIDAIENEPMVRVIKGRPVVFVTAFHFADSTGYPSLFRIDLDRDDALLLKQGEAADRDWLVDETGEILARTRYMPDSGHWTLMLNSHRGWRTGKSGSAFTSPPSLMGLGRDGRSALILTAEDDLYGLREMSATDDDWSAPVFTSADPYPIHDPVSGRMIGAVALESDVDRYVFFDARMQSRWNAILKAFPGQRVTLASASTDFGKVVVRVDSPLLGPAYSMVDLQSGAARWIGDDYAGLEDAIAPKRAIAFKAADGLALTGYLTLPKCKDPKGLPLVVFPHGGPAARDEPGFDWWAQAMASRGYAVLQVNYRGSDGFGSRFMEAGFGEYGRKMQTDLSDGVRWLSDQGVIDPSRVCIVGASYGGYAALAGLTLQSGIYRCAVSVAGVADEARMTAWDADRATSASSRYWKRYVGVDKGVVRFDDISPVKHIDRVSAPILLIHGQDDTVVPYEQSKLMAEALKKAGKPFEFVTLKGEDHWLSRGATRLQMLEATVAFLEKNNPP